jgi:hypothetical protein
MTNLLALDNAAAFSAVIAPAIDRTAISVHNAIDHAAVKALRGEHRFSPQALSMVAGPILGGPISAAEFAELNRYEHFGPAAPFLQGMADRGAVTINSDGSFVATDAGASVAKELIALQIATIDQLYAPCRSSLPTLRALTERARIAAVGDPNSPLAKYSGRAWLPEDASDGAHIWNNSIVLRMHRSDAHAMAWKEKGRTAADMKASGPGSDRDAIDTRTNELAAVPWSGLDASERLTLLAGLAALPGTGSPI